MTTPETFTFGPFRLLIARRELLAHGVPVVLGQRALEILLVLVRQHGQLVTKQDLMAEVWPDVVVEENNLQVHISALRKLLNAASGGERYLLTVAGRGYRFVAPVQSESVAPVDTALVPTSTSYVPAGTETVKLHVSSSLPQWPTPLIGREEDLGEIIARLRNHRLVTLVGSGGIGKTRLAIEAGRGMIGDYVGGVALVELAPINGAELAASAIADVLALKLDRNDISLGALASAIKQRHCLLILDNCEHLIAEVATIADVLLKRCPRVSILATSRERLAIAGESVFRVPSLSVPDLGVSLTAAQVRDCAAVRLFTDRAVALGDGFALTDNNASTVASICQRLDGIPLAIELAVPRLKVLSLQQLAGGLDERFRLLSAGGRAAPGRHQTLRALLDWSYDLLSEPERRLLRRLGVFAGGSTLESIVSVVGDAELVETQILDLLSSLVEKSLVLAEFNDEVPRYRLLETTRLFGREKAKAHHDPDFRSRHARHFADRLAQATLQWETTAGELWLARYGGDIDNLRAALGWAFGPTGDVTVGLELIGSGHKIWSELGLVLEHRRWVERGLSCVDAATSKAVIARLSSWQFGDVRDDDDPSDYSDAMRAAAIFCELGETFHQGRMLLRAGSTRLNPECPEEGERLLHEAYELLRQSGPTKSLARCLSALASARLFAADAVGAQSFYERALAVSGEPTSSRSRSYAPLPQR